MKNRPDVKLSSTKLRLSLLMSRKQKWSIWPAKVRRKWIIVRKRIGPQWYSWLWS